jgi:hypothetical protein
MDAQAATLIGAGLAAIGAGMAAIGVGNVFGSFLESALRNPAAADGQLRRGGASGPAVVPDRDPALSEGGLTVDAAPVPPCGGTARRPFGARAPGSRQSEEEKCHRSTSLRKIGSSHRSFSGSR